MRTIAKICGLRRPQDAEAANRVRQDLAGMILSPGFGRSIDLQTACSLRETLDPGIRTVGVFVDAGEEEILRFVQSGCIDMIQLHGAESDERIRRIRSLTDLPVIKVFRIREQRDLEAAAASAAEWILLDSGTGSGQTFDWDLLETFLREHDPGRQQGKAPGGRKQPGPDPVTPLFPGEHPWILAGGLSPENVADAVRRFHPTGVDVSSRVETDGWKDPVKMAAFVQAVREACACAGRTAMQ